LTIEAMNVSIDEIRVRLAAMDERRRFYEAKVKTPGKLRRQESWAHEYLARPYLIGAPTDRLAERFVSVFMNTVEIGLDGRITPREVMEPDSLWVPFTHLLEEYGFRSRAVPAEVRRRAQASMFKYIEHGKPVAVKMFADYAMPSTPVVVKYGQRDHLEAMLTEGRVRLSNAAAYNHPGLNDAIRDDETSRMFFLPTYRERLAGRTSLTINGSTLAFGDDDIAIPLVIDDYYLFSLCDRIHHRMPTDFHADAALVIRDPPRFVHALKSAFEAHYPNWIAMAGPVVYYDPYRDYTKFKRPEMAKHFGYAYQREVRVAFRPRHQVPVPLGPLFLSVGPMADYADLVVMR
jgi:hypothetical protein